MFYYQTNPVLIQLCDRVQGSLFLSFFQLEELALVVLSEFLRTPEQISKVSVLHVFIYYMLI